MNKLGTRKSAATAAEMLSRTEEMHTDLGKSAAANAALGGVLLGVADSVLAQRLTSELKRSATTFPLTIISTLSQLDAAARRVDPGVIFLDSDLLGGLPLCESVRRLAVFAPVLLLASLSSQAELAELVAEGNVDYIARVGDFLPIAGALISRRLRSETRPTAQSTAMSIIPFASMSELFRHQINNPLTGILGNAELVLAHREHLSQLAIQRLETVVDLAVRLRENIRRLSDDIERAPFV
jgi:signal transduction histidine kinase